MRGYVPQYRMAALQIHSALASGNLLWVGLADRSAGAFDDFVLGLNDRVVGYQLKTSSNPSSFSLRTLLLGEQNLLKKQISSWKLLKNENTETRVELVYNCSDFPSNGDDVNRSNQKISSSAYLRSHDKFREIWSLSDWRQSEYKPFIDAIFLSSELTESEFTEFWRSVYFRPGQPDISSIPEFSCYLHSRVAAIAAILPQLVADKIDKDRWTKDELLKRLQWQDSFSQRHVHNFPIDALVQSNEITEEKLRDAINSNSRGYVCLIGPPGSGKSTLLQASLLAPQKSFLLRYIAYLPNESHGLGRAEDLDFLYDLVVQFKKYGFGSNFTTGINREELREQFSQCLAEAGERFLADGRRTLIIVDGLDHVPREERPARSFLEEFPQSNAIPEGVLFVLGTQRLDLANIPPSVQRQAGAAGRKIEISSLSRQAVVNLAKAAHLPLDVDYNLIWERTAGHPLSLRYIIEGLKSLHSENERREWLIEGPVYQGEINAFYDRAWEEIKDYRDAQCALFYVALTETPLDPAILDKIVGSSSTDIADKAASHLLVRNKKGYWSVFHNSLRLYLLDRLCCRFGHKDETLIIQHYLKLAEFTKEAQGDDPQRWMDLRYYARAEKYDHVLSLAVPDRFRDELKAGRDVSDILSDIKLSFLAVAEKPDAVKLFQLLLAQQEIGARCEAICQNELVDMYLAAENFDAAVSLLLMKGRHFSRDTKPFDVIEILLERGQFDAAQKLYERFEPISNILGIEPIDLHYDNELLAWARQVLHFRDPKYLLTALDRFYVRDKQLLEIERLERLRENIKLTAACALIEGEPLSDLDKIADDLKIGLANRLHLGFFAADCAFSANERDRCCDILRKCLQHKSALSPSSIRTAASILTSIGQYELAADFFHDISPPDLCDDKSYGGYKFENQIKQVVSHATLEERLEISPVKRRYPDKSLLSAFQKQLEAIGRFRGKLRDNKTTYSEEQVVQELKPILTLVQNGRDANIHDMGRARISSAFSLIVSLVINTAQIHGEKAVSLLIEEIDTRLNNSPNHLALPAFRRSYAQEVFKIDGNAAKAATRLRVYERTPIEDTPEETLRGLAETISALLKTGNKDIAQQYILKLHDHSLGCSLPPRKDAQYVLWQELFERACEENATDRLKVRKYVQFFLQFLTGLTNTEGRGSARRVAPCLLKAIAKSDPSSIQAVTDCLVDAGLISWVELVAGILNSIVYREDELAVCAARIFNRLALPFLEDMSDDIHDSMISLAPVSHLDDLISSSSKFIETEGPSNFKYSLLDKLHTASLLRAKSVDKKILERWKKEEIFGRSDTDDKTTFAGIQTLAELETAVQKDKTKEDEWEMVRAFEKIAPNCSWKDVQSFIQTHTNLLTESRSVFAALNVATKENCLSDAQELLGYLKTIAQKRGNWGKWAGGEKFRYHKASVAVYGEPEKAVAFKTFASDLSNGRENTSLILPDLWELFQLFSPKASADDLWATLSSHLKNFREFDLGDKKDLQGDLPISNEEVLADLIFRAYELRAGETTQQAKLTAIEIADLPCGTPILKFLIEKLWAHGGSFAFEAVRIIWELREREEISSIFLAQLPMWIGSNNVVVLYYCSALADAWGCDFKPEHRSLPSFYSLEFPYDKQASRFDQPTGFSASSTGLWTENPYDWTWILEKPLQTLARGSKFSLAVLRKRTAQIMTRYGGRTAFGPEACNDQTGKLKKLGLLIPFERLPMSAARLAICEVAGELFRADKIDQNFITFFLHNLGLPQLNCQIPSVEARPAGCLRPLLPIDSTGGLLKDWFERIEPDTHFPHVDEWVVIAASDRFERLAYRDETIVERLVVPSLAHIKASNLDEALSQLPRAAFLISLVPLYDKVSPIGIVNADVGEHIFSHTLTLCPNLQKELGLRRGQNDSLALHNKEGEPVIRSLFWKDGGIRHEDFNTSLRGDGCLLLASPSIFPELRSFIGDTAACYAWRIMKRQDEDRQIKKFVSEEKFPFEHKEPVSEL